MTYFVQTTDERNACLYEILKNDNHIVKEFKSIEDVDAQEGDSFIFSPAKKFSPFEISCFKNGTRIFGGNLSDEMKAVLEGKNITVDSFLTDEIFAVRNAILTAEGVLSLIIEHTKKSLLEQKVLIIGAGRIAKSLARFFSPLRMDFSIVNFNPIKYPWSLIDSDKCYFRHSYASDISQFDIIINTVPAKMLSENEIGQIKPNALYLETASVDGIDREREYHFKFLPAPALPSRFCPESAAQLMKQHILGENNYG